MKETSVPANDNLNKSRLNNESKVLCKTNKNNKDEINK